jgi:HD-GYP domain-containing protein (c-di-GMP phosphodiesterase class II)
MDVETKKEGEIFSPPIKTIEKKSRRRKPTAPGGWIWKITTPYREWRELPKEIREYPQKAHKNFDRIHEGLIDYRLALMKTVYMAKRVDARLWQIYGQVSKVVVTLEDENNKRAMILHTPRYLKKLKTRWEDLIADQGDLLDAIGRAPASLKFYNMMMIYKDIRQRERVEDEENERRYTEAYNSLELALEYVEEFINKKENDVFTHSQLLKMEDVRQQWSERLLEINHLQQTGNYDIEAVLERIENLKNAIFETPTLAKWIHDIELRYGKLMDDHELLSTAYGKSVIRSDEIKETKVLMTEVIPKLWVKGENQQLEHYMKRLETFLNANEPLVQSEIAFEERHSPWADTSTEDKKESDEIDMLTSFVRIMINAIESRESHMGDHSATVARLSVKTAIEMNWNPSDVRMLEVAGLLHDVGKIWIPESLLSKPGELTESEFQLLRMHPYYSAKIVESISALREIVPWVYYHHERWDGRGYPEGLHADEIPLGASIIAVAEAFSAMIFNSLSRKPLSINEAFDQIREESGKQFDPGVIDAFIKSATSLKADLENLQKSGFSSVI